MRVTTVSTRNMALAVSVLISAVLLVSWRAVTPEGETSMPSAIVDPPLPDAWLVASAQNFISLLDESARERALFDLDDEERFNWAFTPVRRNGFPLSAMTSAQRSAAHDLLQAAMSSQGYHKANAIIELERILGLLEGRPERRDPEDYYVSIFGDPSPDQPWAWRFEGHHLSLNFSAPSGDLDITGPAFMGANPARVPSGPKAGWRPLGREEDLARMLMHSLTAEQREIATIATEAPSDILTSNDRVARLESFEGITADAMTPIQKAILMEVIREYAGNISDGAHWMNRVEMEIPEDQIYFAWAGSTEVGAGHYYRVHTPVFLIEYDNTQGNANHVHSAWRDLENDFGGDALARHYEESDHH